MELGDLQAIDRAVEAGFPILRRIARNAADRQVRHQVVFGFSYQSAPRLVEFLRRHRADIRHLTGVRYSGELGHPFHVVDQDVVILPLDRPFVPEGRFASLLVRDRDLVQNLAEGFEKLWRKAMRSLQEINFDPRRATEGRSDLFSPPYTGSEEWQAPGAVSRFELAQRRLLARRARRGLPFSVWRDCRRVPTPQRVLADERRSAAGAISNESKSGPHQAAAQPRGGAAALPARITCYRHFLTSPGRSRASR